MLAPDHVSPKSSYKRLSDKVDGSYFGYGQLTQSAETFGALLPRAPLRLAPVGAAGSRYERPRGLLGRDKNLFPNGDVFEPSRPPDHRD